MWADEFPLGVDGGRRELTRRAPDLIAARRLPENTAVYADELDRLMRDVVDDPAAVARLIDAFAVISSALVYKYLDALAESLDGAVVEGAESEVLVAIERALEEGDASDG